MNHRRLHGHKTAGQGVTVCVTAERAWATYTRECGYMVTPLSLCESRVFAGRLTPSTPQTHYAKTHLSLATGCNRVTDSGERVRDGINGEAFGYTLSCNRTPEGAE